MDEQEQQKQKNYVLWLLSRQDYPRSVLTTKLQQRGVEDVFIDTLLDWCESHGYIDDKRFCQGMIRRALSKHYGQRRIMAQAQQKGISQTLVNEQLEQLNIDWYDQAQQAYNNKYANSTTSLDYQEKGKRMRYMTARGFDYQHIEYAIKAKDEWETRNAANDNRAN